MAERALNELLDDLAAGRPAGGRDGLDPDLIAAATELRSLAQVPLADTSRRRVDHDVEAEIGRLASRDAAKEHQMNTAVMIPSPNGRHAVDHPTAALSAPASHPARRSFPAVNWFASAALIALLLSLGYAGFLRDPTSSGPGSPARGNLAAPAVQEASPDTSAGDEVVEFPFPGLVLPAGDIAAWMEFFEVLPHEGGEYTVTGSSAVILMVRAGTMAITGELAGVQRASEILPAASPVPGETILGPGDAAAFVFTSKQVYRIRNAGDEKLFFVEAAVSNLNMEANRLMLGLDQAEYTMMPGVATLAADSAVTVSLTRATLAPDESRSPADGGWQLAIGDPARMTRNPMDGTVHNVSDEPHEVFIMTADFTAVSATPVT